MTQTDTDTDTATATDLALKARHRALWASGDYPAVATQMIADLGPTLVEAAHIAAGQRVLDVAAGSGNASLPAARTGADVVASDLTPELLDVGRAAAEAEGLTLAWEQADAEALPYADDAFDAVISVVGVMFAPHHQVAADELVRVCRPGGTLGLVSWTPEGFIGRLFATMKPYAAPPPPGAQPPPLWGTPDHLAELFGDRLTDVVHERRSVTVHGFGGPGAFRDFMKASYGPTIAAYRNIADDPAAVAELDRAIADLAASAVDPATGDMQWDYLLTIARKA